MPVRQNETLLKAFEESLTAGLKQWMQLNRDRLDVDARGRPCIVDGEHGLTAYLAPRKSAEWDVAHMPWHVIEWLVTHSLLTVNTRAFEALRETVTAQEYEEAKRYRLDGSTDALYVEPVK